MFFYCDDQYAFALDDLIQVVNNSTDSFAVEYSQDIIDEIESY